MLVRWWYWVWRGSMMAYCGIKVHRVGQENFDSFCRAHGGGSNEQRVPTFIPAVDGETQG